MYPTSNQPAQLYGTAKTYKHENIDEINIQSLNFRPIIAQTGSYTFNAAQMHYRRHTGFFQTYPGTTTTTVGRGVFFLRYRIVIYKSSMSLSCLPSLLFLCGKCKKCKCKNSEKKNQISTESVVNSSLNHLERVYKSYQKVKRSLTC